MSEPRNPELEQVIQHDPDEASAYQVYGDWLAARGHPRGELIALQARGLDAQADTLLADHPGLWEAVGEFRDLITKPVWRLGFLEAARVANTYERTQGRHQVTGLVPTALGKLLEGPGRFLRDLTVGIVSFKQNDYTPVTEALADRGPLPTLRALAPGATIEPAPPHSGVASRRLASSAGVPGATIEPCTAKVAAHGFDDDRGRAAR